MAAALVARQEPSSRIGCVPTRTEEPVMASVAVGTAERANARVPEGGRCVRCNGESERRKRRPLVARTSNDPDIVLP